MGAESFLVLRECEAKVLSPGSCRENDVVAQSIRNLCCFARKYLWFNAKPGFSKAGDSAITIGLKPSSPFSSSPKLGKMAFPR